jgi:hypothetical protein
VSEAEDGPQPGVLDSGPRTAEPEAARPARRRLSLTDPLTGAAAEDRPESWGDSADSDSDRLRHYVAQRPPHHGG